MAGKYTEKENSKGEKGRRGMRRSRTRKERKRNAYINFLSLNFSDLRVRRDRSDFHIGLFHDDTPWLVQREPLLQL